MDTPKLELITLILEQGAALASLVLLNVMMFYFGKLYMSHLMKESERRHETNKLLLSLIKDSLKKFDRN